MSGPAKLLHPINAYGTGGDVGKPLVVSGDGTLYGIIVWDGANNVGGVYKVTVDGTYSVLYSFSPTGPCDPVDLHMASDGTLYGLTTRGGQQGAGTIFRLTTSGTLTTVYDMSAGHGYGYVLQASNGNYYCSTDYGDLGLGEIDEVTPTGSFTALHNFNGFDGAYSGPLIEGIDHKLYGTAAGDFYPNSDFAWGEGTVFSLDVGIVSNLPRPVLTSLSPRMATEGSDPITVTLTGSGFIATSVVYAAQVPLLTTFVNSTTLQVTLPTALLSKHGTFSLTVRTPSPVNAASAAIVFNVLVNPEWVSANVLWSRSTDQQAMLWWMIDPTTYTSATFGPYSGYLAKACSTGANGKVYILWDHPADSSFVVWAVSPDHSFTYASYGPFTGYKAVDIATTPDNHIHLILDHGSDHAIVLWDMPDIRTATYMTFGPFPGWAALHIAGGPDGHIHVLWDHIVDHQASIFDIASADSFTYKAYGPYSGFTAQSLAITPDNHGHISWTSAKGQAVLWDLSSPDAFTYKAYGPYSGFSLTSLGVAGNGSLRTSWERPADGTVCLWGMPDINSFAVNAFAEPGWHCIQAGTH